ncbi:RNA polymerase sigma factor [Paraliobacillus sp. X-1268]|uniref:RNA polymerase sigma factor n=1 Tax=Paraliobacillus sp. X-1268 TaxID=2213193 RepID=UPI001300877A|nr:sigma-70 family RNA polymerase sigma factor [Paraliobacillus sp. X-1268]
MKTIVNHSYFLGSVDQHMTEKKINELYVEYKNRVYRLALSYVKDSYLAEDLSHEILVKCYIKREKFKGDCSFHSWINKVASNHCIDFLRKNYRHQDLLQENLELFTSDVICSPESEAITNCDHEEIRNNLRQLSSKYKEVIVLYYFKQLSLKEIADQLNLNLSTVKTRLFRAKKMLKDMY